MKPRKNQDKLKMEKDNIGDIPLEMVPQAYQLQLEMHMHYSTLQSAQNLSYIKLLGYFFVISGAYYILENQGILSNFLVGIVIIGVVTLGIMLAQVFSSDSEWDWKLAHSIKVGKLLEEKYPNILSLDLFHRFSKLLPNLFHAAIIGRFAPFAIVLTVTTAAGIVLNMNESPVLAKAIGTFAVILFITAGLLFNRIVKRNFNEENK